ncbi:FtsX-like permease family protein [Candidatus Poriferisodalis sp.]|uniref:ABC transporter permease n=1 Tax=Candidatus Poriferisodalis sp. TaxID=3101277 RepID=UPI003B0137D9
MRLLRLRWSLREGRKRWIQILGIAFTVAIGMGSYAGPTSAIEWRLDAIDASLDLTNMYDLRATVSGGLDVPQGSLARLAEGLDGIEEHSERLVLDTQVETTANDGELLVQGRIMGVDTTAGGPSVNRVETVKGANMAPSDAGVRRVLIESKFARFHGLGERGTLTLRGDTSVEYVGHATSPEYFVVVEGGGSLGQSNFAALFTPLSVAQDIADRPDAVNDVVVTLAPGADAESVRSQLVDAAESSIGVSLDVIARDETPSYIGLRNSPEVDQSLNNVLALLLIVGAGFAALNFSARMVESQRREIGASMAIGETPRTIAIRPMLIGAQISVLGVVLGVALGYVLSHQTVAVAQANVTYPVLDKSLNLAVYARAAAVGFAVPLLSTFWPVLRAVRVRPVEAIRSGHLASRGGSLSSIVSRVPLPGRSLARMPFRNLLRTPRRTLMTTLTFAMSVAILFAVVGLSSSFAATFDRGNRELLGGEPDRFMAQMDAFYPVDAPQVSDVLSHPTVRLGEPAVVLGARAVTAAPARDATDQIRDPTRLDLVIRFVDFGSSIWTPTTSRGVLSAGAPGIALADKAARDFGVDVGDDVTVTHPAQVDGAYTSTTSTLTVAAIHRHPLRLSAYMDLSQATMWGFGGLANAVTGVPAPGSSLNDVKRSLAGGGTGVARVQGLDESFKSIEDSLDQASSLFVGARIFVILLLLLIAFNAANINVDERARDHATMFAYGVPVRRVIANLSVEGLLLCAAAILLGVLLGYALLVWMVVYLLPAAIPEIGAIVSIRPWEMALYLAVALVAVALAPVFSLRKLKNMFIPGKLRVME